MAQLVCSDTRSTTPTAPQCLSAGAVLHAVCTWCTTSMWGCPQRGLQPCMVRNLH